MTDANSLPHYNCALLASVFHHATDQIVVWGQMGPQKGAMVHRDHTRRHKPGMKSRTSMQSCYHLRWMIEHQLFFLQRSKNLQDCRSHRVAFLPTVAKKLEWIQLEFARRVGRSSHPANRVQANRMSSRVSSHFFEQ